MTNDKNLKLAVQKDGRLTVDTLSFLRESGLDFVYDKKRLISTCLNFPLEIFYVRDDDIPKFVAQGVVDLGIIGQNLLYEQSLNVKRLLNLRYGLCSLVIAVPVKSNIKKISNLRGKKIATSYPVSCAKYFKKINIPVKIIEVSGSSEIAPVLGLASAIVDLTSSGKTLALNDLRVLAKIYDSEAVLIEGRKIFIKKKLLIERLTSDFNPPTRKSPIVRSWDAETFSASAGFQLRTKRR